MAGTQEPIYGASAIRSVAEEAASVPYTELQRNDLVWKDLDMTNVETQTFYFFTESGRLASAQVIYNNIACVNFPPSMFFYVPANVYSATADSASRPSSTSRSGQTTLPSQTSGVPRRLITPGSVRTAPPSTPMTAPWSCQRTARSTPSRALSTRRLS